MRHRRLAYHILAEHPHLLDRPRPDRISERNWGILLAHLRDGRTMSEITNPHGITRERGRQICSRVASKVLAEAGMPYDYNRENPEEE
jgi:DNA-directed RNA polymerase sigma subunit (sigma70/sigma32)